MKTVTVIIPVYNAGKYVEQCIESVLNQSYEKLEVIIVNDNSTDNTREVIEYFNEDPRVKLIHFDHTKGIGTARNFAMKQATGEFIYFVNSDDYLATDAIKYLVSHIGESEMVRGRLRNTSLSSSFAVVFSGLFQLKYFDENRYNLIKNNSATHFLLSKKFIDKHNFCFSEQHELFSDLYFMIPALAAVEVVPYINEALYFRRRESDLESTFNRKHKELEIKQFIKVFKELKAMYKSPHIMDFLDDHFLNYYRKDIITHFKKQINTEDVYSMLHKATKQLKAKSINRHDIFLKRELKALSSGNINRYRRVNNQHHFLRDVRDAFKSKRNMHIFLYNRIFCKLPLKRNLVFFESFGGKSYTDNPKYIYQSLSKEKTDYKSVWSFEEKKDVPGHPKYVKRGSLRYFYYLARAQYWVNNARMPNDIEKRESCIYLQTWHGTPLKKLAGDMDNVAMPGTNIATYKRNFSNETAKWDYLISPNAYSTEIFKRAFWYDNQILEVGYPRNDILYTKDNQSSIQHLKKKLGLPTDKQVILYAPTWRDDEYFDVGSYKFTLKLNLEKMKQKLDNDYIVILRMHYLISSQLDVSEYGNFVSDYSSYEDISELYLVSDILITDYSSVFFDYANLKRPILFYTYDLEKYRDELRGFYLDIDKELPGPLLMNTDEVVHSIININQLTKEYKAKYEVFYNRFCQWDDGSAAEQTVNTVFK